MSDARPAVPETSEDPRGDELAILVIRGPQAEVSAMVADMARGLADVGVDFDTGAGETGFLRALRNLVEVKASGVRHDEIARMLRSARPDSSAPLAGRWGVFLSSTDPETGYDVTEFFTAFDDADRLASTAEKFGMSAGDLLTMLNSVVVGTREETTELPLAELEALRAAGVSLDGPENDPTGAIQVVAGAGRFQQFREDALSVNDAARELERTPGRIRQLIRAGELATLPTGDGGHLIPRWQLPAGTLLPGLKTVLKAAGTVHPLTLAGFMTRADVDLEVDGEPVSPVDWLLGGGDPEAVAALAAGLSAAA